MTTVDSVLEYICPCCGAQLRFSDSSQSMQCDYCDNQFEMDTVLEYNNTLHESDGSDFHWDDYRRQELTSQERDTLRAFTCPSCGGEIMSDDHTVATFCPYCESPTILTGRASGTIKPDGVLPFKLGKADAEQAFRKLCKGKLLLPKFFTQESRIEKITGIYVPFWLYSCSGSIHGSYKATRVHSWSDAHYHYTKTDHYLLRRNASANFSGIPMDGSSKINNTIMESIEPFHYDDMVDFDTAYLSGFFADKYDVEASEGEERIRQRVSTSINDLIQNTFIGYSSVVPTSRQLHVSNSNAKYVLLPVWMLHTRYGNSTYVFAMNGQTGKMTGTFPICPKRSAAWFAGIAAVVTAITMLLQILAL